MARLLSGSGTVTGTGGSTSASDLDSGTLAVARMAAGTVIQVKQFEVTETNALTTTYVNYWENSITLKSASSDIFGWIMFNYYFVTSGGLGVKIYRNDSSTVTTSHTAVWIKNLRSTVGDNPRTFYTNLTGANEWAYFISQANIPFKDSLSGFSVDDVLYYGLFARKYDDDTAQMPGVGDENGFMSLILMEVQK